MSRSSTIMITPENSEKDLSPWAETETHVWGKVFDPVSAAERKRWIRQGIVLRTTRWISRQIMHLIAFIWFDFTVSGKQHLPPGGFLLASSHSSHFDTVALVHALSKRGGDTYMLGARDYFFRFSFSTWFFRTFFRILPFDRQGELGSGLSLAHEVLITGHPLLIYPEGTRSSDGQVQPFKPGVGLLGVELGVPIVPCRIQGTFASLPKGKWWPRRAQVSVTFGQPLNMDDFRAQLGEMSLSQLYRQVASELQDRIVKLADATPRS